MPQISYQYLVVGLPVLGLLGLGSYLLAPHQPPRPSQPTSQESTLGSVTRAEASMPNQLPTDPTPSASPTPIDVLGATSTRIDNRTTASNAPSVATTNPSRVSSPVPSSSVASPTHVPTPVPTMTSSPTRTPTPAPTVAPTPDPITLSFRVYWKNGQPRADYKVAVCLDSPSSIPVHFYIIDPRGDEINTGNDHFPQKPCTTTSTVGYPLDGRPLGVYTFKMVLDGVGVRTMTSTLSTPPL